MSRRRKWPRLFAYGDLELSVCRCRKISLICIQAWHDTVEHPLLTAVWHMLTDNTAYLDLGGDYFAKHDPELALRRITRQANALGFTVRFEPSRQPEPT